MATCNSTLAPVEGMTNRAGDARRRIVDLARAEVRHG